jgi:tetratricopeptide (TPR) repeat protein
LIRKVAAVLLLLTAPLAAQQQGGYSTAIAAWQSGAYDDAIRSLGELAGRPNAQPEVHRSYARVLLEVGRTEDAERHLRGVGGAQVANVLGEALLTAGRWDDAEAQFRAAVAGRATDVEIAQLNLGELLWNRGRRDEALRIFDGFIDLYNSGRPLGAPELIAVGRAVRRLAVNNPQLFQDALLAFDRAAAAAPRDPLPRVLVGELFLEKYNSTEAHAAFSEALELNPNHPRALLGGARASEFDGAPGTGALVQKVIETYPRSAAAHTVLARLALAGEGASAYESAEAALAINPAYPEALAVLGAAKYLSGDLAGFESARDRALAINPRDSEFFRMVAEMAVMHRRYAEAVEMATRAVELDSLNFGALGLLGMNQMRVGLIDEGRANLERAFAGDPYNPWFKNSLDLLDTFASYVTVPTRHFQLFLRGDEAELLAPYVASLAEEAYAALAARYGAEPHNPIRLEIFPRHQDFSVRTLGLTGLGALGVAFGSVLVMDSPSAAEPGSFSWGSTLWHELAHAFHLGMTGNKVPRWFTEGLAVHEQRSGRPGWGHPPQLDFFQAYEAGRMPPASELSRAFLRPEYPQQVIHGYYMASLVFAWMEREHGKDAAVRMLRGYGEGKSTQTLVREVLGLNLADFDRDVDRYIRTTYADAFRAAAPVEDWPDLDASLDELRANARSNPEHFPSRLRLGKALAEADRPDEAEVELKAALRLFPGYADQDGPYVYLARIHQERGELELAANALTQVALLNENVLDAHQLEADLRIELGDKAGAARALERAFMVYPYEIEMHQQLAELAAELGDHDTAVRERTAIVALDPVDLADAHYQLARALLAAGRRDEARRQVLRSLEIAPGYAAAQDLLLDLRGATR